MRNWRILEFFERNMRSEVKWKSSHNRNNHVLDCKKGLEDGISKGFNNNKRINTIGI